MAEMQANVRRYRCVEATSGGHKLYLFAAPASELFGMLAINQRDDDKNEGYQRVLSRGRVAAIAKFIQGGNTIPTALIVSLESGAAFDEDAGELTVPMGANVGWVIDGQHRLAGAHEAAAAGNDITMPVVAFIGLSEDEQVNQFITINREARGVPTSLYLDLLRVLKNKKPQDAAKDRAADIGSILRRDESSAFFERIVAVRPPQIGQISLTNFVRKVAPLVLENRGILSRYYEREQRGIIDNYFKGIQNVYADEFRRADPVFFRTIGFGAMLNAFPVFFSTCLAKFSGFTVEDTTKVFRQIGELPIDAWRKMGSGNLAETQAGDDVRAAIDVAFKRNATGEAGVIKL